MLDMPGEDSAQTAWLHPSWVKRFGHEGEKARHTLSNMLAEPRMRGAAEQVAERHGIALELGSHGFATLDALMQTVLRRVGNDTENFILLLGHVALHARLRAGLIGRCESLSADLTIARTREVFAKIDTAVLDRLAPPRSDDPWLEGCHILTTALAEQGDGERGFARFCLPVGGHESLAALAPRKDAEPIRDVLAMLVGHEEAPGEAPSAPALAPEGP